MAQATTSGLQQQQQLLDISDMWQWKVVQYFRG